MQIVKYVKNGHIISRSVLRCTYPVVTLKRHSNLQPARFSSHSYLSCSDRTYGCRDICSGLHPCSAIFAVPVHFTLGISRAKAMGKRPFLQLVPRARDAPQRPGFATLHSPGLSSTSCENFSPRSGSGCRSPTLTPLHGGEQTDRKTDVRLEI